MIKTKIVYNGRKVTYYDASPQADQMFAIANAGVDSIKARVAKTLGSDDAPMRPLANRYRRFTRNGKEVFALSGYARRKQRKGLRPVRDLMGTGEYGGHMLDFLRVTSASPIRAVIDISGAKARVKARANQKRAPWFGFSGGDIKNLIAASTRIWQGNIDGFTAQFRQGAMTPKWMDPLGLQSGGVASRTRAGEIARAYRGAVRGAA